jgi:hypothetical protein
MWSSGDRIPGRAKLEAALAMHASFGNHRGLFKSAMYSAEVMHWGGDTAGAIRPVKRVLPELGRDGTPDEYSCQLSNLAAYLLAEGDYVAARQLLAKAAASIAPRRLELLLVCAAELCGACDSGRQG